MLLIISDLHMTDGSTGTTVGAGAFEDFRQNLIDLATDASERSDGTYRPLESIDLILLGDIFDIIRSTRWTDPEDGSANDIRPWDDDLEDPDYVAKVSEICDAILEANSDSFAILKAMATNNPITVPTTLNGAQRTAVKTNIYYLVGNHDWFLHLNYDGYESIREKIRNEVGLANPPGPFPHDPFEADWLMDIYKAHGVFARHGDIYDDFNYNKKKGRDSATLGDAFVLELINRFPKTAIDRLETSDNPIDADKLLHLIKGLKEVANVRPSLMVPIWVNALLENLQLQDEHAAIVKDVWDELGQNFLNLKFVKDLDTIHPLDAVDKLQITLKAYDLVSFKTVSEFLEKATPIATFISDALTGFDKFAAEEKVLKEDWVRHIVYGHTHHSEVIPLDKRNGRDQIYYNSGTWLSVHELTKRHRNRFVFYQVMTYLAFFKEDERKGRPFETWNGTLGARLS